MTQINLRQLKRAVKNFLHLPVTRVEVLEHAKELQSTHQYRGLCALLNDALGHYEIWSFPSTIFPKFRFENARHFGTYTEDYGYWWEKGRWDSGRLDYLNWLIKQYEGDNTNIRKL